MALHFEQVSLASLPANLLAAAVVAPVMWLGMLGIAVAQVSPALAAPLNVLCAPLLGYLEWVAHAAASAPLAAVPVRLGGPAGLVAAYAALPRPCSRRSAAAARWRAAPTGARRGAARGRRSVRRSGGARAACRRAPAARASRVGRRRRSRSSRSASPARAAAARPPLGPGELVVSFLDVGQGDATLLQRDAASVLVDTGPPGGPILRRLARGRRRAARPARAHARGGRPRGHGAAGHRGVPPAARARRRRRLADRGAARAARRARRAPAAARSPRAPARCCASARCASACSGRRARSPRWRPDGNPNDRAVVAHVRDGAFDLLLPADAESNVTAALDLPRVEALKVAHHGSADEGLPALLERTAPAVAAIEVGADNTYGHPAPSTLDALRVVPRARADRPRRHRAAARRRRPDAPGAARAEATVAASRLARGARPSAPPTSSTATTTAASPSAARGCARWPSSETGAGGVELLEGDACTPDAVAAALCAMTFALGRRFVIADGVERWKDADVAVVADAMKGMDPETLTVAFFGREEGRYKVPAALRKAVEAAGGQIAEEGNVKPRELPRWLVARAAELGVELDTAGGPRADRPRRRPPAAAAARAREARARARRRARSSASRRSRSRPRRSAERKTWTLADALVAGDEKTATRALLELRQQGERVPGLLYGMVRRLRDALAIAEALAAGQPAGADQARACGCRRSPPTGSSPTSPSATSRRSAARSS